MPKINNGYVMLSCFTGFW